MLLNVWENYTLDTSVGFQIQHRLGNECLLIFLMIHVSGETEKYPRGIGKLLGFAGARFSLTSSAGTQDVTPLVLSAGPPLKTTPKYRR